MKKIYLYFLCTVLLTACFATKQSNTDIGKYQVTEPDKKTAYQIWLDQGNTGTEYIFWDTLNINENKQIPFNESLNFVIDETKNNTKTENILFSAEKLLHNERHNYNQYNILDLSFCGTFKRFKNNEKYCSILTYNSEETPIMSYGVWLLDRDWGFGDIEEATDAWPNFYAYNKEAQKYTPEEGDVFEGNVLAYVYEGRGSSTILKKPKLFKGKSEYIYDKNNSVLMLKLQDYYTLKIVRTGSDQCEESIIGDNLTQIPGYNLSTEPIIIEYLPDIHFYQLNSLKEFGGTYRTILSTGTEDRWLHIIFAFGGQLKPTTQKD